MNDQGSDDQAESVVSVDTAPGTKLAGQNRENLADSLLQQIDAAEAALANAVSESDIDSVAPNQISLLKVIIQVPCFNEEETLGVTLSQLPRKLEGVAKVEWLVVDDGSQDETVKVARRMGVEHIVKLPRNQGLARAFVAGLEEAIRQKADIIVNTDADNQYCASDIQNLIDPIIAGDAEFVVGARPIQDTPHFSRLKKTLQWLGSWVVRQFSTTKIPDAPSGFRAMSRETAMRLNVFSDYTYTLETVIQAGQKNMAMTSVPIRTNADLRPSRLFKSIPSYVGRSALTIIRIFMTYRPFQFFAAPGAVAFAAGFFVCLRYLVFYFNGAGGGHVQSLILGTLLMALGFTGIVVGLVADLISVNRKLLEKVDWRVRQLEEVVRNPEKSNLC